MTQKWETFDHKIMEMCDIFSMGIFLYFRFVLVGIAHKLSENRYIIHILNSISSQRMLMHEYIIDATHTHTRAQFFFFSTWGVLGGDGW